MKPVSKYGRAHFYAPYKLIGNIKIRHLLVQYFSALAGNYYIVYSFVLQYFTEIISLSWEYLLYKEREISLH